MYELSPIILYRMRCSYYSHPYLNVQFFFEQFFPCLPDFPENFPAKIYLPNKIKKKHSVGKISPEYPMLLQMTFFQEISSKIAKYPMLLPRFQNFPAKCPKSEIFLRNLPQNRSKKNNYSRSSSITSTVSRRSGIPPFCPPPLLSELGVIIHNHNM